MTKESRPICLLVRRLSAEAQSGGRRVVNFADNSSNVWGGGGKGPSSAGRFKRFCVSERRMLRTDLKLAVPHVPTYANPWMFRLVDVRFVGSPFRQRGHRWRLRCWLDELLEPIAGDPYASRSADGGGK